ncbi:MAG TPA: ABC-F family ATP-binding cassette domain-containing protein [Ignavibacteriaceae bacterium]|nr:ABC-F family ATP-binding cassette domain-containing protein [Ignavibacteriaceae bacterium]
MIDLSGISLQFNGKYLFRDINYKINSGDKISLVGANGTGKSSLLKILKGTLQPESGKILKEKNISIGYLPQENVTHEGKTLLNEAKEALTDIINLQKKEIEITDRLAENLNDVEHQDLIHQLGEVHHRLEELDSYSAESRVEKILIGLGFEQDDFDKLTNEFSGGWQMRIALAKILISQNDLLLLDEPTNHLDFDSLEWLIGFLKNYKGALLIVSHDKHFINQVTNKTLEIFLGKFNVFNGDFDAYLKFKKERDLQLENQFELQQKKIKETERFIERFRYKASKARQVQSRVKQLEKISLIELPESKSDITLRFPSPPPSGKSNIKLKSLSKSYGNKEVLKDLDLEIMRGEKIAFVGPNGAGKTTLAKIIAGVIDFNSGERIVGYNTLISYYAQDVADNLEPELDIIETVEGIGEEKTIGQLRSLLGSFLFSGDEVFKKIGVLSGGEKSRVALAKILLTKANFIILDEPTNHLDMSSKEILQKALIDFDGSLVLVSHDIDFLSPIANKVVDIRKGFIKTFEGGIDYYLGKRQEIQDIEIQKQNKKDSLAEANSRKEQKRIEAELRQKKYKATKYIAREIEEIEKNIDGLEKKQAELESFLADEKLYSNPAKSKEVTLEYNKVKENLNFKLAEWARLSEEMQKIEDQFS